MWVTGGVPVTHLRKLMLEELQRRNYAENTIRHYVRAVEDFARRFRCSPDRLGPRHIREYQAELFQKRKLSANSVGQHLAALRFFYVKTLRRAWSIADTPYPKKTRHLPTLLSREEVNSWSNCTSTGQGAQEPIAVGPWRFEIFPCTDSTFPIAGRSRQTPTMQR